MSPLSDFRKRHEHGRPVIGVLFGFQMFGAGKIYDFVDSLTRGIQAGARDRECLLLLSCGVNLLSQEKPRPAWPVVSPDADFVPVGPWNTDGLIVVHPLRVMERSQYIRELKASGFPIVFVGTAEGGPAIDVDNAGGVHRAVSHLVQHGHRAVAYIAGFPDDNSGDSIRRLSAFRRCVDEFGLTADPALVAFGHHQILGGRQAMQTILSSGVNFSAVLASNDESALGAMQVLEEAGLRVPEDVAVIGFDNRPDVAYELPSLTTVHHPVFERGYRAVELLMDCLEGKVARDDRIVQTPTRLVTRHSCGCSLQDIIPGEAMEFAVSTPKGDAQAHLLRDAMDAILHKTMHAKPIEAYEFSAHLVEAFVASLESGNETDFLVALQAVLTRAEQTQSDVGLWQVAVDALEKSPALEILLDAMADDVERRAFAQQLFRAADVVIRDSKHRQNWRNRQFIAELEGHITAHLSAARDEVEIVTILAQHAPKIGIRRAAIALFEPENSDPVAWSVMRTSINPGAVPIRFPSREFPPPEFCTSDEAARLALVPLVVENDVAGYLVVDTDNLPLCADIVSAVNTALKTSRMYRNVVETSRMYQDAVEHRRVAEEASSLKSRFLSAVSHELSTPLNFIVATSEFLEKERHGNDGDYASNIAHIRASAQQVEGLVRDVLDLARDEIGQLRLTREAADLATTLKPVAALGERLARAKGLSWRADIPAGLPLMWVDRARIRQVALNLITNAVKFTEKGQIVLSAESEDDRLVVSVQDSGVGVPEDEREAIFNEFHQSTRTAGRGGGLGLGLTICKKLIELHLGEIGVLSAGKDAGSTFFFTVPALKTTTNDIVAALVRGQPVLIVDKPSSEANELQSQLEQRGFKVRRMDANEPSLLEKAVVVEQFGAVLLNASLPALCDGKLAERFREYPAAQRSKLLFYSLIEHASGKPLRPDVEDQPVGSVELSHLSKRRDVGEEISARTVLVVEDDPRLLKAHAMMVQSLSTSHRVLKARNGREAMALIKEERPDLVLLDLVMPEMGGFEVLDAMQTHDTTRQIPVIVLSGQMLTSDEMARLHKSVTTVLTKGVFTVEETQMQIRRTLEGINSVGEARRVVRRAIAFIHSNYQRPIGRTEVAQYLRISENHLSRCFRQVLQVPPMTYLARYRVNRAKALLGAGDMTVTKVAAATGFLNEYYFSYVFRRETGVAPSAFRKEHKKTSS